MNAEREQFGGVDDESSAFALADYSHVRVLLADDEPSVASLIQRVVETRLNCQVVLAIDGDEALQALENESFNTVITDMQMPGLHGLELIGRIHARWPEISIVAMTGYPSQFPYVEAIQHGASDFLNKPFAPAELEAKVVRIFNERELRIQREKAERKYRSLFEMSADGMVLLDERLVIDDANKAFRVFSNRNQKELIGSSLSDLVGGADRVRLEAWMRVCAQRGSGTMADMVITRPDGSTVHADLSASFIDGDEERIVLLAFKDVTEKRQVDQRLQDAAQRDELTGLLNKRSFNSRFEGAIAHARRDNKALALCLIDLDNFKRCNDTHGHQIGDKLLITVGDAIKNSVRTGDEGFRFGGDEFAVLLQGTDDDAAVKAGERIQSEFAKNEAYGTTMSIGAAILKLDETGEALIKRSDEALYAAKAAGKNVVRLSKD